MESEGRSRSLSSRLSTRRKSPSPEKTSMDLVKHADLFFRDGSIILKADRTLFRVHQSQLSRHSLLFRDMFSLPQAEDSSHTLSDRLDVEGCRDCPLVEMHDAPEDVAALLTALYDGPTFGSQSPRDFGHVAGILRLSTKYIIDSLRAKALAHLSIAWPSNLKAWDAREDHARAHEADGSMFYPSPIAVINLAREIDAPSLLPSAFYALSRYSYSTILEEWADQADDVLSPSDFQKLSLGKEAAQQMITTLIQTMSSAQSLRQHQLTSSSAAPHPGGGGTRRAICMTTTACRKDFEELVDLSTQHYLFDRERGSADPLYVAEELGQLKSSEELGQLKTLEGAEFSECRACARSLEVWAARQREMIWRNIPSWFRLD